jgi:hypothetical protein
MKISLLRGLLFGVIVICVVIVLGTLGVHRDVMRSSPVGAPSDISGTVSPMQLPDIMIQETEKNHETPGLTLRNTRSLSSDPWLIFQHLERADGSEVIAAYNRSVQIREMIQRPLHDSEGRGNHYISLNSVMSGSGMITISSTERADRFFFDRDAGKTDTISQNTTVQVWIFGDHYLSRAITPVQKDGSISYILDQNITDTMSDQQYEVLFLYQEKNQPSLLELDTSTGCAVIRASNPLQKTAEPEIICMDQVKNTSGLILGDQFIQSLSHGNFRYEKVSMTLSPELPVRPEYWIDISPIGNHTANEEFSVTGTTNLPAGSSLKFFTYRSYFCPGRGCPFVGPSGNTTVLQDTATNQSYNIVLNGSAFPKDDEFLIEVQSSDESIGTVEIFQISS